MNNEKLLNLRGLLIKELTVSEADFRSVTSLSEKFGVPEGDVRYALIELEKEGVVRRPYRPRNNELSWYRLTDRGLTKKEKRRRLFTMLANDSGRFVKPEWY